MANNPDRLKGRHALISGADSGIGRAVALAFAREGADVAISYLSEETDARETERLVTDAGRKAVLLPGDIGEHSVSEAVTRKAIDAFGTIDILVNNAAFQRTYEKFEDIPDREHCMFKLKPPDIRLSEGLRGSKEDLLRVALEFGLEGLVAKRLNSVYESGRRSGTWVKIKLTKAQDFVIGGYTLPEGNRKYFGSLVVGCQGPDGLLFAGRVGTGFSEKLLASVAAELQKLKRSTCPFINLPEQTRGRWAKGSHRRS